MTQEVRAGRPLLTVPERFPTYLFSALIVLAIIGVGVAARHVFQLDGPTWELAGKARRQVFGGEFATLDPWALLAAARVLFSEVFEPLAVMLALFALERLIGPRQRSAKNYALICLVQFFFISGLVVICHLTAKGLMLLGRPLLQTGAPSGTRDIVFLTIPMYLLFLLVSEFFRYWVHRAQHAIPLLWRFHGIHHSARDLNVLQNATHPLDQLSGMLFVTVPVGLLIGVDARSIYLITVAANIHTHFIHMNSPVHFGKFGKVIVDNRHHFIHHSRHPEDHNRNFAGLLPVMDMLFGTYKAPTSKELPPTGFDDAHAYRLRDFLLGRRDFLSTPAAITVTHAAAPDDRPGTGKPPAMSRA